MQLTAIKVPSTGVLICRERTEFQEWCNRVANEFKYSVQFEVIGHATEERKVMTDNSLKFAGPDVGGSTQVSFEQLCRWATAGCKTFAFIWEYEAAKKLIIISESLDSTVWN